MPNEKTVVIKKGNRVTNKILITEFRGVKAYSLKHGDYKNLELFRAITESEYNAIIKKAKANGHFIYTK